MMHADYVRVYPLLSRIGLQRFAAVLTSANSVSVHLRLARYLTLESLLI